MIILLFVSIKIFLLDVWIINAIGSLFLVLISDISIGLPSSSKQYLIPVSINLSKSYSIFLILELLLYLSLFVSDKDVIVVLLSELLFILLKFLLWDISDSTGNFIFLFIFDVLLV